MDPLTPAARHLLEQELARAEAALQRFATYTQHKSRWRIAATLYAQGSALVGLGRYEEGLAVCTDVARRFCDSDEPPYQALVAGALHHCRVALLGLGRPEEELAVCREILRRFGSTVLPAPELEAIVADARRRAGEEAG